jgi:hypothetical protein
MPDNGNGIYSAAEIENMIAAGCYEEPGSGWV